VQAARLWRHASTNGRQRAFAVMPKIARASMAQGIGMHESFNSESVETKRFQAAND